MAIISNGRKHLPKNKVVQLQAERVVLDYPRQGESIDSREYAVRVGAPADARTVEVAIDQGDWLACRPAVGYWWYDWSGFEPGEHEVIARAQTPDGRTLRTEIHDCFVAGPAKTGAR